MKAKKVLISGILIWIVSFIFGWLTCGWLFNWVYKIPPNIWKGPNEIMNIGNMIGSNLVGILRAILFALVYMLLYKGIPGKGIKKGVMYGFFVWLLGAFTGIASMSFYMTISTTVVIYWIIQGLVISIISGAIVGAIYKES